MFNLTRQERAVLLFLGSVFFLGVALNAFYKSKPLDIDFLTEKTPLKLDINKATFNELLRIPGIGPVLAQRIIMHRRLKGEFRSISELKNIKGIGERKLSRIKDFIYIGN